MKTKIKQIFLRLKSSSSLLFVIWAFILSQLIFQPVSATGLMDQIFPNLLPKPSGSTAFDQLRWLISNNLVYYIKWILVAVSILYITLYGFLYITASGKEENISEQHDNLIWAVIGFAVVGISNLAFWIFSPVESWEVIDATAFNEGALKIVVYIEYMLGAIASLYMLFGAIKFIMAGGDESIIDQQKKNFTWGFFGLIIVMIADTFIKVVYNRNTKSFSGNTGTSTFSLEVIGVVNYVLAFMGVIAILTLVIASVYYVTAMGDEERTGKAMKIIQSTLLGFVIISIAYVVVFTFAR